MSNQSEGAAAAPTVQEGPQRFLYAYCHGFLSGPGSVKGQALRQSMLEAGLDMTLLNLNGADNDPGAMACSRALQAVRDFHLEKKAIAGDPGLKLRLVGSSLGGYIVARYADLYPNEVDRIFMLCPSFGLATRAPKIVSDEDAKSWERDGAREFPLSTGGVANVPWTFVQDALLQPDYPGYVCPATIVHGLHDEVVPVQSTRAVVEGSVDIAKRTMAMLVQDDHALADPATLSLAVKMLLEFFDLGENNAMTQKESGGGDESSTGKPVPNSQTTVEVEAKFSADNLEKVKTAISARGGQLVGEQVFTDVYWDAPGCGLTENDWWLRCRAGRWELKMPAGDGGQETTAYREVTLPSEIVEELTRAGFLRPMASISKAFFLDARVLKAAGFEVFASFRTNRTKYRIGQHTVDIDQASFGHEVVEVEVISGSEAAEIAAAGESVVALAQSLGVSNEGESGRLVKGKLAEYILKNCPKQLKVLRRREQRAAKGINNYCEAGVQLDDTLVSLC